MILGITISFFAAISIPSNFLYLSRGRVVAEQTAPCLVKDERSGGRIIPKAAIVHKPKGKGVRIIKGVYEPQEDVKEGDHICENRRLSVPGTSDKSAGANLGFVSQFDNKIDGYLAVVGFSNVSSEYFYPCAAAGSTLLGWKYTDSIRIGMKSFGSENEYGCPEVLYSPEGTIIPIGSSAKPNGIERIAYTRQKQSRKDRRVASVHLRQYCSVVANSGKEWNVNLSQDGYREDTVENVCRQAIENCQEKSGEICSIVSQGDWKYHVSNPYFREVNILLQCSGNRKYYKKGTGEEVYDLWSQLELEAQGEGATSCALYVYGNDEVLITPESNKRTLVHTDSFDNGFVIHTLIGTVEITPPGNPVEVEPILLEVGERYRFIYDTSIAEPQQLSNSERKEVLELPVVQAFLNLANWKVEIHPEIIEYQKALNEQFLKSSAVQVERIEVDGVDIWKTEIDLNNPNTIVTLVKQSDVQQAGSFTQFAKNSKAALIASGTFEDRNATNWTMISEGKTIEGERSKNWSNYTVLGLRSGNQAEMFARPDVPEWNEYWFALTGHPRLVSGGNPGITEVAPGSTLNINGSVARAAIGFSSKEKKLYHIVTNDPIPLNRLAKIMHLIGCDQAMNLEGRGGMVLACKGDSPECNGTPLVSGEVRSPLIVVYDAQHRDERITQAWELFQASDRLP
ncbi:MAG: phosphodiester glycosidase family protein [Symploca sp. SIO2B6]|nr:phosphodiester glycosidase family protein [Symploca sp. SIO2B6]